MSNILEDRARVNQIRSAFWEAGYRPVILYSEPPEDRKRPVDHAWTDHARATPSPYVTERATPFAANTGILCDGLRVVDVDVEDAAKVTELRTLAETMLGTAPIKWRENSPRVTLLYRAADGEPAKRAIVNNGTGQKVEVLGRGNQFVAHGMHDSGVPIQWTGLRPRDALIAVTEDQITAFLAAAREIIGATEESAGGNGSETEWRAGDLSAVDTERLESIYSALPNDGAFDDRDAWVTLAHATAAAFRTDLWRGERLFRAHAERYHGPIKEGEADKVWASVTNTERADQPIPDDATSPHRVGAGYIVQAARETGVDAGLIAAYDEAVLLHDFTFVPAPEGASTGAGEDFPADPQPPEGGSIPILTPNQCEAATPRPYVVKGIIGRGDFGLLNGPPGAGKSALAPHIAYAVAQGRSVFGKRVRQGPVLYLAAEDGDGMRVRVRALRNRYGDAPDFHLVPVPVDLMTPKNPKLVELQAIVKRIRPVLIVVDTLKRAFPGIVENSGGDDGMGRVIHVARGFAGLCQSAVLILHHMPHDADRSRGHSSLPADADVDMVVRTGDDGKTRVVRFTKNRNGTADLTLQFGIRIESLGTDEDGDPVTAVTADEIGTGNATEKKDGHGLTKAQGRALGILQYLGPNGAKVAEAVWVKACQDQRVSTAERDRDQRRAIMEAFGTLAEKGLAKAGDGMIWTTPAGTRPGDSADDSHATTGNLNSLLGTGS